MEKMFKADSIHMEKCECGCNNINTYLLDETGLSHAVMQLDHDQALSFAAELTAVAIAIKLTKAN